MADMDLGQILREARTLTLERCAPEHIVSQLEFANETLLVQDLTGQRVSWPVPPGDLSLFSIGKASAGLARAAYERLGERLAGGLVVAPEHASIFPRVRVVIGGHPLPDGGSRAAAIAAKELVAKL